MAYADAQTQTGYGGGEDAGRNGIRPMTCRSAATVDGKAVRAALCQMDMDVSDAAAKMLAAHLALVAKWNRAYNLTAIADPGQMLVRHVLDSAAALPFLRGTRLLDAGSGAGFPGLTLAVLAPATTWVLAESAGKKARFLDYAIRRLGLAQRVSVHAGRLERYRPERGFDTVTARAVAEVATLAGWSAPLLAPDGRLVALKGRRQEIDAELAGLPAAWRAQVAPAAVPGLAAERHIVVLERKEHG